MRKKGKAYAKELQEKSQGLDNHQAPLFLSTFSPSVIERPRPDRTIKIIPPTINASGNLAHLKYTVPPAILPRRPEISNTPITSFIFFTLSLLIFKACLILS